MNVKKGELIGFNSTDYTATVKLAGSHRAYLEDVTVARNIPVAEMVAGRKIAIVFFDEHNAKEAVIIAVYSQV